MSRPRTVLAEYFTAAELSKALTKMLIRASIPPSSLSQIGGRIARKRIHVRIEHVQHSKCRNDFLERRAANDAAKAAAHKAGKQIVTKRTVAGPRDGFTLENVKTEILTPIPYDIVREGIKY